MNNRWKKNNLKKVARRKARVAKRRAMTRQWIHKCIRHGGKPRAKAVLNVRRPMNTTDPMNWLMSRIRRGAGKQPLLRQKMA